MRKLNRRRPPIGPVPAVRARGFTIFELMIAVAIAGILAAVAVPNLKVFAQNNRLAAGSNDLLRAFQVARSEAIKRQQPVALCGVDDSTVAVPACNYSTFKNGWIVFVDTAIPAWQTASGSVIVERHGAVDPTVTVKADNDRIELYDFSGFAVPTGTKTPTRNIVLCDVRGTAASNGSSLARGVLIANTGRARVTKDPTDISPTSGAVTAVGGCP